MDVTTSQGELLKNVSRIINDPEILFTNPMVVKESVLQEIYKSLGIEQTKNKMKLFKWASVQRVDIRLNNLLRWMEVLSKKCMKELTKTNYIT